MIEVLLRAMILWALNHQVALVRDIACGFTRPCSNPEGADDGEEIIRQRFDRLPRFIRPPRP